MNGSRGTGRAVACPGGRRALRRLPARLLGGARVVVIGSAIAGAVAVLPVPAAAQEPSPPEAAGQERERPVLRVTATGRTEVPPDRAILALAVETFADSAGPAVRANAERTAAVLRALRDAGVPEERLRTTGYRLEPEYARDEPVEPRGERRGPRVVGYRAVNAVEATLDSVARAGELIDRGVAAGANRVLRLSFRVADPSEARQAALRDAVARARREAETLADASGVRLGPIVALETGEAAVPIFEAAVAEVAMRADTPVEPGLIQVTATVTVTWRLDGPARQTRP